MTAPTTLTLTNPTQANVNDRLPRWLADTPEAGERVLRLEGLKGPINLKPWLSPPVFPEGRYQSGPGQPVYEVDDSDDLVTYIDAVVLSRVEVIGGDEPMHPDWVRNILGQCQAADVAFGLAWGRWVPKSECLDSIRHAASWGRHIPFEAPFGFGGPLMTRNAFGCCTLDEVAYPIDSTVKTDADSDASKA